MANLQEKRSKFEEMVSNIVFVAILGSIASVVMATAIWLIATIFRATPGL